MIFITPADTAIELLYGRFAERTDAAIRREVDSLHNAGELPLEVYGAVLRLLDHRNAATAWEVESRKRILQR